MISSHGGGVLPCYLHDDLDTSANDQRMAILRRCQYARQGAAHVGRRSTYQCALRHLRVPCVLGIAVDKGTESRQQKQELRLNLEFSNKERATPGLLSAIIFMHRGSLMQEYHSEQLKIA